MCVCVCVDGEVDLSLLNRIYCNIVMPWSTQLTGIRSCAGVEWTSGGVVHCAGRQVHLLSSLSATTMADALLSSLSSTTIRTDTNSACCVDDEVVEATEASAAVLRALSAIVECRLFFSTPSADGHDGKSKRKSQRCNGR